MTHNPNGSNESGNGNRGTEKPGKIKSRISKTSNDKKESSLKPKNNQRHLPAPSP